MRKDNIIEWVVNALLLNDFDFNDHNLLRSTIVITLVYENLIKIEDEKFLDFDVVFDNKDKNHIIIKSKNLITSLWFDGIFPDNCWDVYVSGKYEFNNRIYIFDEKTGKLGYKQLTKDSKNE